MLERTGKLGLTDERFSSSDEYEPRTAAPKVKSLHRAFRVLECFTVMRPELGITEIAQMLNMTKSNVHSIIATLCLDGYIEQLPTGKYALGLKMLEYAFIINQRLGYPRAVYDILVDVANKIDEVVYFGLPWGTNVLYLYVAHPKSRLDVLPYRNIMGEKAPLFCTGIGKAMLAHLPKEEWESRIPRVLNRFTKNTMSDRAAILDNLELTRHRGYSVDNSERDEGVRCVGVPVFNSYGKLVAGLSISGPAQTMTDSKLIECSLILKEASLLMRDRIYN